MEKSGRQGRQRQWEGSKDKRQTAEEKQPVNLPLKISVLFQDKMTRVIYAETRPGQGAGFRLKETTLDCIGR